MDDALVAARWTERVGKAQGNGVDGLCRVIVHAGLSAADRAGHRAGAHLDKGRRVEGNGAAGRPSRLEPPETLAVTGELGGDARPGASFCSKATAHRTNLRQGNRERKGSTVRYVMGMVMCLNEVR